jgi:SAM-dependent methyltransferase
MEQVWANGGHGGSVGLDSLIRVGDRGMADSQDQLLITKLQIADLLGVSVNDLARWAQQFASWLDVCPGWIDRTHDEADIFIFTLISKFNRQIGDDIPYGQRISLIEHELQLLPKALSIRQRRTTEKARPEIQRWGVISGDACLRYEYEWLMPLRVQVESIADFGCWPSEEGRCSEPYALLWTLEATRVVVIDKNPEYIRNAQKWLESTRGSHHYFKSYNLEFIVGDMTDRNDALGESAFDLSYCANVLYNMYNDPEDLRASINVMARVVKPNGWVIAVEPKMGVEFKQAPCEMLGGKISMPVPISEPADVSHHFEAIGLVRVKLDNAPDWSYCYKKQAGAAE